MTATLTAAAERRALEITLQHEREASARSFDLWIEDGRREDLLRFRAHDQRAEQITRQLSQPTTSTL